MTAAFVERTNFDPNPEALLSLCGGADIRLGAGRLGWRAEPPVDGTSRLVDGRGVPMIDLWFAYGRFVAGHAPLLYWESFDPEDYALTADFEAARAEFDSEYRRIREPALQVLGQPVVESCAPGCAHSVWRTPTNLRVLQQAAHDPQFGLEINWWIQPWNESSVPPFGSLIDWLHELQRVDRRFA
ncbi:hypothetical protein LBMAG42_32430 [Deltaproteobacteria bacterium]|nr:hypothetical protein LBMAG42_32430 [Deltaproteobacteria bacterium]